jgi:hypothetical protein
MPHEREERRPTHGAIVTFPGWVWLTNIGTLLGIELDSDIERERQRVADQPGRPSASASLEPGVT